MIDVPVKRLQRKNTQIQTLQVEVRNIQKKIRTCSVFSCFTQRASVKQKQEPSVTVTKNTEESNFGKKGPDSLQLPSKRAKRQSFLVLVK